MARLRQYCNAEPALALRLVPTLAVLCLVSVAVLTLAGTFFSTQAEGLQLQNIEPIHAPGWQEESGEYPSFEQPIYLKASNTGPRDKFGIVAISGDTLVVSAREESSNATGVNGNQGDNTALYSGAVYVCT